MAQTNMRLYFRQKDGRIVDGEQDFALSSFGGVLPNVGDLIVEPGVPVNLDRHDPRNRMVWTVVSRIFNPRDLEEYVALVVEERRPQEGEFSVVVP